MKKFQLLMAVLLLVFAGSAFGDDVWVVHPDYGDYVNSDGFTIIAKADNIPLSESRTLEVVVTSSTGQEKRSTLYPEGVINAEGLEIVQPKPSRISDVKFPIVVRASGYSPGERLTIELKLRGSNPDFDIRPRITDVTTK